MSTPADQGTLRTMSHLPQALFGLSSFKVRTTSRLEDTGFGTHRLQELGETIQERSSNIHVLHQIDLRHTWQADPHVTYHQLRLSEGVSTTL